ncbi:MAG TPA: DUF3311 domain-containing protein [Acidobacteriota bacterium]|nr:DUF3311 domain-containing protein [Acidobacteriota bacterium]
MRRGLYLLLPLLYLLHNDFWWWNDSFLFLGLPIGLSYHLLFCLAVSVVMWLMVRHAWPHDLQEDAMRAAAREPGRAHDEEPS